MSESHTLFFSFHTILDQSIITWYLIFQFFFQLHTNVPTVVNVKVVNEIYFKKLINNIYIFVCSYVTTIDLYIQKVKKQS